MSAEERPRYGYLLEFGTSGDLLAAVHTLCAAGYRELESYTPEAVPGLDAALPTSRAPLPLLLLAGALVCGGGFYLAEYLLAAVHYPHDIGGRPPFAWPAFIFPALELMLLGAGVFGLIGMLALDGLPRLNHPLFEVPSFARASRDRYFLCVRAADPRFDAAVTRALVESLEPESVHEVAP